MILDPNTVSLNPNIVGDVFLNPPGMTIGNYSDAELDKALLRIQIPKGSWPQTRTSIISVKNPAPGSLPAAICDFSDPEMIRTFTSRSFEIESLERQTMLAKVILEQGDLKLSPVGPAVEKLVRVNQVPIRIVFNSAEAKDVSVRGGKPVGAELTAADRTIFASLEHFTSQGIIVRELTTNDNVQISWTDEVQSDKRDIVLLVIGGLLGVAGAALLELIKLGLPKE